MKIKVENRINLKESDKWRINLHSFYNILQVLYAELNIISKIIGASAHIELIREKLDMLNHALSDPQHTSSSMANFSNLKADICRELKKATVDRSTLDEHQLQYLEESVENFKKILSLTENRTEEFLGIITRKDDWHNFSTLIIKEQLKEIFLTMALRSQGRYGVSFSGEYRQHNDYFIDMQYPPEDSNILLPSLLPDIIRDLCANSRKYSEPGTTITCSLKHDNDEITLTVRDQGRGIPEDEISMVVEYGYRASNVADKETFGDGFGLTKAYLLTVQNNGSMWIDSELGKFTEITIKIPIPEHVR